MLHPPEQKVDYDHVNTADVLSHKLIDTRLDADYIAPDFARMGDGLLSDCRIGQVWPPDFTISFPYVVIPIFYTEVISYLG